ncbi:riboflavin synthase [Acidiferrimicrobium sp. IK]|uniref:riboflavin synthase n=1 Tax=Acidiferrimicrobium sp. IK TaxID=2871700 RepID=UPI0021CAE6C8|nr:riboflavin synthase [Acidiferrimicrobium sp. IK]MCU4184788.1 riboflavin synthase [Acidiferrimicrobium sp. IK]
MFTGIVEEIGRLRAVEARPGATRMVFAADVVLQGSAPGDSIAVNGCCLTVVDKGEGWWAADAVGETLGRTNLRTLAPGDPVNLERPVRLADRLGGHLVQGHVDGVGTVVNPAPDLRVRVAEDLLRYLVPKGSVTVDGCSLTVVDVIDDGFSVAIIPHTAEVTVLGQRRPGDGVNLEVDVIAKYAERLLAAGASSPYVPAPGSVTPEALPEELP